LPALPSGAIRKNRRKNGRFKVRENRHEHGGFADKQGYQPSRRARARHVECGTLRPPRGAERGLEANGRRFRTANERREAGEGLTIDTRTERQVTMTSAGALPINIAPRAATTRKESAGSLPSPHMIPRRSARPATPRVAPLHAALPNSSKCRCFARIRAMA
jgi:hypothetical protein